MVKVRLRGVYATALTRLLLDEGFEVVQLSPEAQRRFGLGENPYPYDVTVHDRTDLQGVEARGSLEALEEFRSALTRHLLDVVVRAHPSSWEPSFRSPREARGLLDIEFPAVSKRRLDEFRSRVVPTLPKHHYYRAAGGNLASAAAMAEKLLVAGRSAEEVQALLEETIRPEYPAEDDPVGIQHVKLRGPTLDLGRAVLEAYDEGRAELRLRRTLRPGGLYDGLGVRKEEGDYAVTDVKLDAWSLRTRYFSKGGALKGAYVNLNTPVELYPTAIRYVDLEVDLTVTAEGDVHVVDEERLDEAAEKGVITEELAEAAKRELERLLGLDLLA
ncbi:MAG: DUF402 domain-containing protein [Candidatus Bathyarchaeia archaeon]